MDLLERKSDTLVSDIAELKELFSKLDDTLNCMIIPFTLKSIKESRLTEDEISTFEDDYENYKKQFVQLLRFCSTFIKRLKEKPIDNKDGNFSKYLDKKIKDTVDFYENVMIKADSSNSNQDIVDKIKDSFFAYLMLSRALNSTIREYNKEFPDYQIDELKNIPDPKYLDVNVDLEVYFSEVVNNTNKFLN